MVVDFIKQENQLTAIYHSNTDSVFLGYFQAVFEENPTSVYGYTLQSLSNIACNQDFGKLTASASSELEEPTTTHFAGNVLDGELSTAWVEGVQGVGINEWIKLETTDGSKLEIAAIEFSLGYQKNEQLLQKNGWPCKVLIEAEGDYQQEATLYNYTDIVILDKAVETSWMKITILEAYAGTKYEDTCISEICLRGMDAKSYFEK